MAITKIHGIKTTVDKAIAYICNPDKTDENIYISSFACAPETAALDFKYTLDRTSEQLYRNDINRENKAFHLIQAFEPGEVSHEEAHAIGKELADRLLGGRYSYVLATHIDKGHVHSHIIFCAADNLDYKQYHDCKKSYWHIRSLSDQLCKEHGLSVIEPSEKRGVTYKEWSSNKDEKSWKSQIRKDINQFVKLSSSYEEFLALMTAKGYELKNTSLDPSDGKYISFRPVGRERFVRGSTRSLGKNYTKEQIYEQIENKKSRTRPVSQAEKRLRQLIDMNNPDTFAGKPGLQKWASKENLKITAETYSRMTAKNIHNFTELEDRISSLQQLSKTCNDSIISIEQQLRNLAEVIKYACQYQENKSVHDRYEKAKDQDRFFRKYESQIILFSGAERMLKRMGIDPHTLNLEKLHSQYEELKAKKQELGQQQKAARTEIRELELIEKNMKAYLAVSSEREPLVKSLETDIEK